MTGNVVKLRLTPRKPEAERFDDIAAMLRRRTVSVKRGTEIGITFRTLAEADTFEELIRQIGKKIGRD